MATRRLTLGALVVTISALLLSQWQTQVSRISPVVGRNNTALFVVTSDHGLSNVHLATAQGLLERHPHVRLHFASFAPLKPRLHRISSHSQNPNKHDVQFHLIDGLSVIDTCITHGKNTSNLIHPRGLAGIAHLCKDMQLLVSPWAGDEHLSIYSQVKSIIDEVDPAVVVDTALRPALDATRDKNRLYAFITPNTLIDNFPAEQPWAKMLWKYPAYGSGIPYPVPWSNIPENILLNVRFIWSMLSMPGMKEKRNFFKAHGLTDPISFLRLHRPDVPWLTQTTPGASLPVDFVPPNVTCTGPMTLSLGSAAEQDEELAAWLARAPTILINLGGDLRVQVLWKFRKEGLYSDSFMDSLAPFTKNGRLRVEHWLAVEPLSLMETGNVIVSVHHGGSGCYHEAISAGIPHVILPLWLDLYGFAQLGESIGVAVWGCRETNPYWTPNCLYRDIVREIQSSEGLTLQEKSRELGLRLQQNPGRYIAAQEIAKLAGAGI
ncbi:2-hydroxyacylsphingosine 1-beta-galactosyltransferase [Apiospora hydei]|uniref:2-hydroxyacylsphingosine 1-beta-galactosyltransferase n=1 Tax=Apiospora hydei TaxID=1337664 RepID=A0ABR1WYR4_9PEZI